MRLAEHFIDCFFAMSLINSLINRSMNVRFCLSYVIKITLKIHFGVKTL